ncbi:pyruvate kinase alpha/beta domain-containing protein [Clostridium perfringens]|nr:pyruvate kinase alpha/beta domain-containing protein [Clostridium perfringens]
MSQCRPDAPIVTVTPNERVAKKVALCFGVYPVVA